MAVVHRSHLAVAAATLLLTGLVAAPAPAVAAVKGVDLHLGLDRTANAIDGEPVSYRFTITNGGSERATDVSLRWGYQEPVQPAQQTDGGYVDVHVARPAAANCRVDQHTRVATCSLKPLAPGASTSVTFAGTADSKGATEDLAGTFSSSTHSAVRDRAPADNVVQGGWTLSLR